MAGNKTSVWEYEGIEVSMLCVLTQMLLCYFFSFSIETQQNEQSIPLHLIYLLFLFRSHYFQVKETLQ